MPSPVELRQGRRSGRGGVDRLSAGMTVPWRSGNAPASVPATPLSRVGIGLQTGGFASPPRGGFALYSERQLIAFPERRQSVRRHSHVADQRPAGAKKAALEKNQIVVIRRQPPSPGSLSEGIGANGTGRSVSGSASLFSPLPPADFAPPRGPEAASPATDKTTQQL